MTLINNLRTWWQVQTGEDDTPFDGDLTAFFASLIFHMALLICLGILPMLAKEPAISLVVTAPMEEIEEPEPEVVQDFAVSDQVAEEIGANSVAGEQMAMSLAPVIADVSAVPAPDDVTPTPEANIDINNEITVATGLHFSDNLLVKGAAGEGVTGATGAIDRLTQEILRSLEERKTLVVWLFDQSASLERQRKSIHDRFDRIYEELGVIEASGNPAFAKHEDKPLLTSMLAFGQNVTLRLKKPTDDLKEIKDAVAAIEMDSSGTEKVFSAVYMAVEQFKQFRTRSPVNDEPERNVMVVVFSDEMGDDQEGLETTIAMCRRYAVPVYVVGVPAPFGQRETLVKWVDPDPQFDQSPQWGEVNQGPESFLPERIKLSFNESNEEQNAIDSGFGPFALTRLCYETGGIYFTVHPNRNVNRNVTKNETEAFSAHFAHFFDPNVMRRYRPDYVSADEYKRRVTSNKARAALVTAAQKSWMAEMEDPRLRFVKRGEAELSNDLTEAQKVAAKLEPMLLDLYETLRQGEADRAKETVPRWIAGYDLAMGRTMAMMVRTQAYNAMLAEAKRGLKFKDPKNNTWILEPANEVGVDSRLAAAGKKAEEYLKRVVTEHPGTPWALLAQRELDNPIGFRWTEEFTDLAPQNDGGGGGNNNNPANDARNMIKRGPPKRAVPKL